MPASLSDLRTRTRRRADQENSSFCPDAEVNAIVNSAYAELYDLIVSAYEDFFITNNTTTLGSSSSTFGDSIITGGILKLRHVEYQSGSDWVTIPRVSLGERNDTSVLSYQFLGGTFHLMPAEQAYGKTIRVWAVPGVTSLSADIDTINSQILNSWDEYIVVAAAIRLKQKAEEDVSALMVDRDTLARRIRQIASDRDAANPERVRDVRSARYLAKRLPGAL